MTFQRLWMLALLIVPAVWLVWQWPGSRRRKGLLLKTLAVASLIVALAEPVLSVWETRQAVAVLADTSASISEADLVASSDFLNRLEQEKGRHLLRILPFAREARPPLAGEHKNGWALRVTPGPAGRATDLEAAMLDALASMPAGLVPRIVVISDGKQNRGSAERAAWRARDLGIPVDTVTLTGRPKPELEIGVVRFPATAFTGEKFPVEMMVRSPARAAGVVRVTAEGRPLGESRVTLKPGLNQVRVHASLDIAGAFDIAGTLRTEHLGEVRFAQTLAIRRPKVLYLSQDPPGTEKHLLGALRSGQFDIEMGTRIPDTPLDAYEVVILNNLDLERTTEAHKKAMEAYVRRGGGLLVIGGERNAYVEDPLKREDPLERVLPAKLRPPRSPEGTCVVLIVDKSSSMEGRKMELARLSAIGVVDNLRPVDRVGVLIFDNSFQWAVPIRKAENRTLIKRLISGITPDGGTQIAPALAEAYRRVMPVKATFKHIVLLTDGISEEGDSIALAREAASHQVTISTVGLGQDVNKSYLQKVAMFAKGKSYFLTNPSGLARILLRDVREHTGQTTVEKAVRAVLGAKSEVLAGLSLSSFPPLKGYVRFETKPTAETTLKLDAENDPLLARWQYGLGKAAVFTSDAKSRWAGAWVGWSGFDTFWTNVVRDLLPHGSATETRVTVDRANSELRVEYRLGNNLPKSATPPEIYAMGPSGFRAPLVLTKRAPDAFTGRAGIRDLEGFYRVRTLDGSRTFPEAGIYLQEAELQDYGHDKALMRGLARFTGGNSEPRPRDVFRGNGRGVAATMPLWPGLVLLALAFSLAELVLRKWSAIRLSP